MKKRLQLKKVTIRDLDDAVLQGIAGGATSPADTMCPCTNDSEPGSCVNTCQGTCTGCSQECGPTVYTSNTCTPACGVSYPPTCVTNACCC